MLSRTSQDQTESIYLENSLHPISVYHFEACQSYLKIWQAMQTYTQSRTVHSTDQIWMLQHKPVFTQGRAGKPEHLLNTGNISVIQTDRGGQVTYHGPGQLVVYLLLDLSRRNWTIRNFITRIETTIIQLLAIYHLKAYARPDAPGVYVNSSQKIASLGLKIKRHCSFHGFSLNIDVDLEPFTRINPCGFKTIEMVNLLSLAPSATFSTIKKQLESLLINNLSL